MISPKHFPNSLQRVYRRTGATEHTPQLPIWFHRFNAAEEPDPDLKVDPSDINYPSEIRCPNCDELTTDLICRCGATIHQPNTGEFLCN